MTMEKGEQFTIVIYVLHGLRARSEMGDVHAGVLAVAERTHGPVRRVLDTE